MRTIIIIILISILILVSNSQALWSQTRDSVDQSKSKTWIEYRNEKAIKIAIDSLLNILDFSLDNGFSGAMVDRREFVDLYEFKSIVKNDSLKLFRLFSSNIEESRDFIILLNEYSRVWQDQQPNGDTTAINSIWASINSKGFIYSTDYHTNAINNISRISIILTDGTKEPLLLGEDKKYRNRKIFSRLVFLDFAIQFADDPLQTFEAMGVPIEIIVSATVDRKGNISNLVMDKIEVPKFERQKPPFEPRQISGYLSGGFSSASFNLDYPEKVLINSTPGLGFQVSGGLEFNLWHRKNSPFQPGFTLGFSYADLSFRQYLNSFTEKKSYGSNLPDGINYINVNDYQSISVFTNIVQETRLRTISIPLGVNITTPINPDKTIGISGGIGLSPIIPISLSSNQEMGFVLNSEEVEFMDPNGGLVNLVFEDTNEYPCFITEQETSMGWGLNAFYSIALLIHTEKDSRFTGFLQLTGQLPVKSFKFIEPRKETLSVEGTGEINNLLHLANGFKLNLLTIQAGFSYKLITESYK